MRYVNNDTGESVEAWPQPHAPTVLLKTAEIMTYLPKLTFAEHYRAVPCRRVFERRARDRKDADRRALLRVLTPEERVEFHRWHGEGA
jgi:hypothetical protein